MDQNVDGDKRKLRKRSGLALSRSMILHDLWFAFLAFANCLSRDRSPDDQQESAGRDTEHDERPELMIIRLSAKRTFFFHW